MAKADLKTQENDGDVDAFIAGVEDEGQREDTLKLVKLMKKVSRKPPKMWGGSIIGFGKYHYKYKSGREGDWMVIGLSPRKRNISLYIMSGFTIFEDELERLGKHKVGVGCLYIKRLDDIDLKVLEGMLRKCVKHVAEKMDKPNG